MSDDVALMRPAIGKRVYMVILEKMIVVPAIVRERVTRETVEGVASSYILDFGVPGKEHVPSASLEHNVVVETPQEAYQALLKYVEGRAQQWRNERMSAAQQVVHAAVENSNKRFGPTQRAKSPDPEPDGSMGDMDMEELMMAAAAEHMRELDDIQVDVDVSSRPPADELEIPQDAAKQPEA